MFGSAACAGSQGSQSTPSITTTDSLVRALRQTGAEVRLGSIAEGPYLKVPARSIGVGGESILTYEYATVDDRRAVSDSISADITTIDGRPVTWPAPPKVWARGRLIIAYTGSDGGTILLLNSVLGDPLHADQSEFDEPYPPAVTAAIQALAEELSVDPAAIEVSEFENVDWPDACLGMRRSGESCAQSVTPGWRVDLLVGSTLHEVRTDLLGTLVRLK